MSDDTERRFRWVERRQVATLHGESLFMAYGAAMNTRIAGMRLEVTRLRHRVDRAEGWR